MEAAIIMVEPKYAGNIGLICRAMKNFGISELILVKPSAGCLSGEAVARAMHASEILKKAKIADSLEKAISKFDYAVATTAKVSKGRKIFRTSLTPEEFAKKFSGSNAKVAIVLGRDDKGLANEEIKMCDFIVHIPASFKYPTLNISHSAAIILYELFRKKGHANFNTADSKTKKMLVKKFEKFIGGNKHIKNKEVLLISFKGLVSRSLISKREACALMSAFDERDKK